ncbi:hypothetical protein [Pseudovibrio ascidiaceicola]|uniref:hypothetical protein n=1 Tax=Pseudovibrio ascidiaceicola TaxID=285279 RepID=UPI000D69627E|nr:hypothetical protein [Pseudovibrio ascidiaceicola]
MHSATIIQFPAIKQSSAQTLSKTVQQVGEEALAQTKDAHRDLCTFLSDLSFMVKETPQDRRAISARILAMHETLTNADIALVKMLQQMETATPAGTL